MEVTEFNQNDQINLRKHAQQPEEPIQTIKIRMDKVSIDQTPTSYTYIQFTQLPKHPKTSYLVYQLSSHPSSCPFAVPVDEVFAPVPVEEEGGPFIAAVPIALPLYVDRLWLESCWDASDEKSSQKSFRSGSCLAAYSGPSTKRLKESAAPRAPTWMFWPIAMACVLACAAKSDSANCLIILGLAWDGVWRRERVWKRNYRFRSRLNIRVIHSLRTLPNGRRKPTKSLRQRSNGIFLEIFKPSSTKLGSPSRRRRRRRRRHSTPKSRKLPTLARWQTLGASRIFRAHLSKERLVPLLLRHRIRPKPFHSTTTTSSSSNPSR